MSSILLASVFLPLLLAPIALSLAKRKGVNTSMWFSFIVLAISTTLLIVSSLGILGSQFYVELYKWSQFGDFGLRLDGLSIPFAIIIYIICTSVIIFSKPYMLQRMPEMYLRSKTKDTHLINEGNFSSSQITEISNKVPDEFVNKQIGIYYSLLMVFSMAMVGTVLATNLIEFYVFFELTLIPAFFLIAFYGYTNRKRVSLMFFFWTHVGAVVLLLGLLAMGIFAGGFDFSTIKENISSIPENWITLIVAAIVIGLAVKLGVLFLHIWVPFTYTESPIPVATLLASAMSGIGIYGILRIWVDVLSTSYSEFTIYVTIWGVATMIYGGAMALMQNDIRKLLAYSSISSMGYILFGIGSESVIGISGVIMMYVAQGLGKAILFMMAGSIFLKTGTTDMTKLGGLARKMPYTATIAMIGALTMIGIPPTAGFISEWLLFNGALQAGVEQMDSFRVTLFAIAILTTILSFAYVLWMYKKIFFGESNQEHENLKDSKRHVIIPLAVLAGISLIIGTYPDIFLNQVIPYTGDIFKNISDVYPVPQVPLANENEIQKTQISTITINPDVHLFSSLFFLPLIQNNIQYFYFDTGYFDVKEVRII